MKELSSSEIWTVFLRSRSEEAFREIVSRYIDFVFSTAVRRLRNESLAEDVCQQVFAELAQKARSIGPIQHLGGWLHRQTCFISANIIRTNDRRIARERQAVEMHFQNQSDSNPSQVNEILDECINALGETDRQILILRYFEQLDFKSAASMLGVTDDTAQKRASRAIDRLRELLMERGVAVTTVALSAMLGESLLAAPQNLATSVAMHALTPPAATGAWSFWSAMTHFLKLPVMKIVGAGLMILGSAALVTFISQGNKPAAPASSKPLVAVEKVEVTQKIDPPVSQTESNQVQKVVATPPVSPLPKPAPVVKAALNKDSRVLKLQVRSQDLNQPIPNVKIIYGTVCWSKLSTASLEECVVTTDINGIAEIIYTISEGDDRLIVQLGAEGYVGIMHGWWLKQNDRVPSNHTVQLSRATKIGGIVVNEMNQPVANATVNIGRWSLGGSGEMYDQDSLFDTESPYGETKTDINGKWSIFKFSEKTLSRKSINVWHPDYLDSRLMVNLVPDPPGQPTVVEQLKALTHVYQIKQGVNYKGLVQGPNGIPVTNATVLFGTHMAMTNRVRETITGPDGAFAMNGCHAQPDYLTIYSPDYAPEIRKINPEMAKQPMRIVLSKGEPVRIRLLDDQGKPVAHPAGWLGFDTKPAGEVLPQILWRIIGDKDGWCVWTNTLPDKTYEFRLCREGDISDVAIHTIKGGPSEATVRLKGAKLKKISGAVVDALTKKPLTDFRLLVGHVEAAESSAGLSQSLMNFQLLPTVDNPKGQFFIKENQIHTSSRKIFFKVEAEGYRTFLSREYSLDTDFLEPITFPLLKEKPKKYSIQLANGAPGSGACYAFVKMGCGVNGLGDLEMATFDPNGTSGLNVTKTPDGSFEMPPDDTIKRVLIAHPNGFARAKVESLKEDQPIRLQPWAVLKLKLVKNGLPLANHPLTILPQDFSSSIDRKTDNNGDIFLQKAAPGEVSILSNKKLIQKLTLNPGNLHQHTLEMK